MSTTELLETALDAIEGELEQARGEVESLERQRKGVLAALGVGAPQPKRQQGNGQSVDVEGFVGAIRSLGGSATTADLVDALGVESGNQLTGARTNARKRGLVAYSDGVYSLAD